MKRKRRGLSVLTFIWFGYGYLAAYPVLLAALPQGATFQ